MTTSSTTSRPWNWWMTDPDFLGYSAHVGWAGFITVFFALAWGLVGAWIALGLITVLACIKEFWYDANYETPHQTFSDNLWDTVTYVGGSVLGIIVTYLVHIV